MTLKLTNSLTRKLEVFRPLHNGKIRLYTCGPTVYDYQHVGNWSAYIYWDILVRTLLANGYTVERVMNITDVGHLVSDEDEGEDKLEKGARREGKTAWAVAEFYSENFLKGMERLGLMMPEHIVRATDYIDEQLDLVATLKAKGYTYQIDDGIYFDTSKFLSYANFARLDIAAQKAGARATVNPQKRRQSDFAVWKFTPAGQTRDMQWPTPPALLDDAAGNTPVMGFPGWHLECSAIAMRLLGSTLDIHTGGIDHIPVHHTNEIAQSEAATGQPFSRYWLHNNHLKVDGTKISKSLGNGYTLEDLAEKGYDPMDFRMFVLQGNYRAEGNFTFDNLEAARNRLQKWRAVAALRHQIYDTLEHSSKQQNDEKKHYVDAASKRVTAALSDDLNTPEALRVIDETFSLVESSDLGLIDRSSLVLFLQTIDEMLGLQLMARTPDVSDDIKQLLLKRRRAREAKDWKEADTLRKTLESKGITIKDAGQNTLWSYAG